jgi:hypothetical protein
MSNLGLGLMDHISNMLSGRMKNPPYPMVKEIALPGYKEVAGWTDSVIANSPIFARNKSRLTRPQKLTTWFHLTLLCQQLILLALSVNNGKTKHLILMTRVLVLKSKKAT